MRTILLLGFLLAGAAQAQTLSSAQLTKTLNGGGATTRSSAVYSSVMPTVAVPVAVMSNTPVQKQYVGNLTFQYSNYSQFGGMRDFQIIQKVGGDYAYLWPDLLEETVRATLKKMAKDAGFKNENLFLEGSDGVRNLNDNIARLKAQPAWIDLYNTSKWLSKVWQETPTYKEAGGIESSVQVTASSPLIDPNGTPNYTRVITSFPFTVR